MMNSTLAPQSVFDPPSWLYILLHQPHKTLLRVIDFTFSVLRSKPGAAEHSIRIVCISDTHTLKTGIPAGDVLIHAGDLTNAGTPGELQSQIDWLDSLPHKHKVAIAGNHDTWLDPRSRETLGLSDREGGLDWKSVRYLQHTSTVLRFPDLGGRELKVFGAPQIPACGGKEFAFQYERGYDAWSETVPEETDVLVTHTPPKYHLDLPAALGCEHLLAECWRVRPGLHIFGHVHAGKSDPFGRLKGGREIVRWEAAQHALEVGLSRGDGLVMGLINPRGWMDLLRVLWHGIRGVLWDKVWGGERHATILVNAALMYNDTGELRNTAQVVDV